MKYLSEYAISVPLEKIDHIAIYRNVSVAKRRMSPTQILKQTGADYIINGTLYNMSTGNAVCPLKYNDYIECESKWTYWGYQWNTNDISLDLIHGKVSQVKYSKIDNNQQFKNHIACTLVVMDGLAVDSPIYNTAQSGKRGRTAIGTKVIDGQTRFCMYASKDGRRNYSPKELGRLLASYGWRDAIMLDCGGSSQFYDYVNNKAVSSSRKVAHYILVYLNKEV